MTIALAIMVFQTAAWALIGLFSLVYVLQDVAEGDRSDDFFMPGFPFFVTAGVATGIAAWQLGRSSSPRRRLGLTAEYGVAAMCYLAVSLAIMEVPDGAYPLGTVLIAVASLPAMVVIPLLHRPEVRDRCRSDAPRPGWLIVIQVVMWSQVIPVAFAAYVGLIEFGGLDAGETASRGNGSLAYGWPIYVFVVGTTVAGVLQLRHRQPVNRRLALAAEYVMPVYIFAILIMVFEVGMGGEDPALWSASVCAAPLAFVIPMLHMRRAREWFDHAPDHE